MPHSPSHKKALHMRGFFVAETDSVRLTGDIQVECHRGIE